MSDAKWGRDAPREDVSNRFTGAFHRGDAPNKHVDDTLSRMLGDNAKISSTTEQVSSPSTRCDGCNRPISAGVQFVQHENKRYHKECFNVDLRCGKCNKPVFGNVIAALNKNWHPECFHCCRCNVKLANSFMEQNGDPYCTTCGKQPTGKKVVEVADNDWQSKQAEIDKRNAEAKAIFNNIQQGKSMCVECGRVIGGMGYTFQGVHYHEECFKCGRCSKPMAGKGMMDDAGTLICEDCSSGKGFKEKCVQCLKPIDGEWLNVAGHKYHKSCFTCWKCRKPFEGGQYVEKDGHSYHPVCIGPAEIVKVETKEVAPGQRKGFTVDPRTGKKKWAN